MKHYKCRNIPNGIIGFKVTAIKSCGLAKGHEEDLLLELPRLSNLNAPCSLTCQIYKRAPSPRPKRPGQQSPHLAVLA